MTTSQYSTEALTRLATHLTRLYGSYYQLVSLPDGGAGAAAAMHRFQGVVDAASALGVGDRETIEVAVMDVVRAADPRPHGVQERADHDAALAAKVVARLTQLRDEAK